jgi:hypothetical protein
MLAEDEVATWWDAMTAAERTEKAKELGIWDPFESWLVPWRDLSASSRQKISIAFAALATKPELIR